MRSRTIAKIHLQLNQMNSECQTKLILSQVIYDALLEVQYWVGGISLLSFHNKSQKTEKKLQKHAWFSSFLSVPLVMEWHAEFILIRCLPKVIHDLHMSLIVFIESTCCMTGPSIVSQLWHNLAQH